MKFALIIASRGRPEQAATVVGAARMMASGKHQIEYMLAVDADDPQLGHYGYFVCDDTQINVAPRPAGVGACWNRCAIASDADMILALPDDGLIACPNWDDAIAQGVVGYPHPDLAALAWNDTANPDMTTVIMASRGWIQRAGLFDERFPFWWADIGFAETWAFTTGKFLPVPKELLLVTKPGRFNRRLRNMALWWKLYAATRKERLATAAQIRADLSLPTPDLEFIVKHFEARDAAGLPASEEIVRQLVDPPEPDAAYLQAEAAAIAYLEAA